MTLLDNKLKILPIWMMIMHITMGNGAVKKILHQFQQKDTLWLNTESARIYSGIQKVKIIKKNL
jgi:hypothetical protein